MNPVIEHLRTLPRMINQRDKALNISEDVPLTGFAKASRKNLKDIRETWRGFDMSAFLSDELILPTRNEDDLHYNMHCNIPQLDTLKLTTVNGYCHLPLQRLRNGIIMGGLRDAMLQCAELAEQGSGQAIARENPYQKLNSEHFSDGIFLYIPDGVETEQPIQLQNIVTGHNPLLLQTRNLIITGHNCHVTVIHCDDSCTPHRSVANNVTELVLGAGSRVQYYKLANLNNSSALLNQTYVTMQHSVQFRSNTVTFNGGLVRNHTEIRMRGEHCDTEAHGLYLVDKDQHVDNHVYVEHAMPNCISHELFKGILDDRARGNFSGHVLVCDDARKTEACMSNKNILLTDKATINTHPFLEIYNDDVKCSHGATTGQVNEEEMFYIRSRGISERVARTMLLYAFCDEVVSKIALPQLRDSIGDMVKKRLHGELTACNECAIPCSSPCNGPAANFHLDKSKL